MSEEKIKEALRALERILAYTNGLGDGEAYTIRAALAEATDVNEELLEALKECLPRIEEIRLVDLGAVRDAEMQDYNERKILTRRELAETNELINKINKAIASAEKGYRE